MKEKIEAYKKKLEKEIADYMENMPISERSASAIYGMLECWEKLGCMDCDEFTKEDAEKWNAKMENADGTTGGVWNVAQTNIYRGIDKISDYCFNTAMNMMYSDYGVVAKKYGVDKPEFFADLAKAFLYDKDGGEPTEKMAAYYHGIVD